MSDQLEAILLRLGLDASGYTKGVRGAAKDTGVLEKSVSSLKGEMASLAAQAAAGIGFAVLVHEALDFAEAVTKVSEQTGLSIESVQFLRLAADQTGTSVDALAGTVNKLQKQLVEAGSNDKLKAQIEDIVGPIENLRALKPEEQLQKVAESIAGINDPAERTAAAVALLGKSGADAIPELTALAQQSDELTDAFQRTGGAVSGETIAAVEGLGDSVGQTKIAITALATELLGTAAPALNSFLQTVTEVIGGLRLLDGQGDNALVNLDNKIQAASDTLDRMKTAAESAFTGAAGATREEIAAQEALLKSLEDQYNAITGLGVAGAVQAKQDAAFNALLQQNADASTANLLANLGTREGMEAEFAGMRLEALAAEMDAETKLRIEMLQARNEGERAEAEAQAQFMQDMAAMVNENLASGAEDASNLKIMTWQQETQGIASMLEQQTAGVARHSRAMFEINKAAGIVSTVISTAKAVAGVLGEYPGPVGWAMAAVQGALGAVQIQAISSAQFGSKTAPSQAATPAVPVAPVSGGGGQGSGQTLRVEGLSGDQFFSSGTVRTLAAKLLEFQKDGGQVVLA